MLNRKTIILFLTVIWLASCSTQKNTWWSRNYHSVTSKYNALYNGEQSFYRGEHRLMQSHKDNFNHILEVFPYSGKEKAGAVKGEMDRAIEKGQKIIAKKSITARPKRKPTSRDRGYTSFYNKREFNRKIDEAYILIGKAHLYNHEFNEALIILDYVLREYANHPVRFEALIWMARARIEMGDYENAHLLLKSYDSEGDSPEQYYGEYMATYASYLIKTDRYMDAIPYMKVATDKAQGKWYRTRRMYALAQLYQITGQHQLAAENFKRVIRSNPSYEMELNARLNYLVAQGNADNNFESARRQLERYANQSKNIEYRDRIYHVLALSYLDNNDSINAIINFRLSAGYNFFNETLKTETFLQLADLYFKLPDYPKSYTYYDSTLIALSSYDARYSNVNFHHSGLKDLTLRFETIEREDSLLLLSLMPEEELDAFIEDIIEQERQAQIQASSGSERSYIGTHSRLLQQNMSHQLGGRQTTSDTKWYFYNPVTASLGKMEFERNWGRRSNEDNWRRSDKSTVEPETYATEQGTPGEPAFPEDVYDELASEGSNNLRATGTLPTKEELMANIPFTEEQKQLSNEKLANAYFEAGMVFLNYFKNSDKAIEMFRLFVTNFPNHPLAEQAWFWAYMSYIEADNIAGAEEMKKGLLRHFPDGRYAEFANNPQHAELTRQKKSELNHLYEKAYIDWQNNSYINVLQATNQIINESEEEELIRKSRLLRSLTYGEQGNTNSFKNELKILSDDYTTTLEGRIAQNWLAMLAEGKTPVPGIMGLKGDIGKTDGYIVPDKMIEESPLFEYNPDQEHYVMLIVEEDADINRLIFNIADYNFSRFLLSDYEIDNKAFLDERKIITIGPFFNYRELMDYYYSLRSNPQLFRAPNVEAPMLMAGTKSNIDNLLENGNTLLYRDFFSHNYLNGGGGIIIQMTYLEELAEKEEYDSKSIFTTTDGTHWAMVILPPRINQNRVSSFLTSHALNVFKLRIDTRIINLSDGETVLLLEAFNSLNEAKEFIESLKESAFWNKQLRAENWLTAFVSPGNFDMILQQGSTKEYYEFIE